MRRIGDKPYYRSEIVPASLLFMGKQTRKGEMVGLEEGGEAGGEAGGRDSSAMMARRWSPPVRCPPPRRAPPRQYGSGPFPTLSPLREVRSVQPGPRFIPVSQAKESIIDQSVASDQKSSSN
jgi:hypothetical protein